MVYKTIGDKYGRTAAMLKDCSIYLFQTPIWGDWTPFEKPIELIVNELMSQTVLDVSSTIERVGQASTAEEKAEVLFHFLQSNSYFDIYGDVWRLGEDPLLGLGEEWSDYEDTDDELEETLVNYPLVSN